MSIGLPSAVDGFSLGEPALPVRRFTVAEYLRLHETEILTEDDRVELLEGIVVQKMTRIPRHDAAIDILAQMLRRLLSDKWYVRDQKVLLTNDSAPEPDLVVLRGQPQDYWTKHPTAAEAAIVLEVSESSLDRDRRKCRIYSKAGIANYWIVNLDADCIEVHTQPDATAGAYKHREVAPLAAPISFSLPDGTPVTLPLDVALNFK
jgi:Uma2 family endonuclease